MGCDLLTSRGDVSYDRMILFAPALTPRFLHQRFRYFLPFKTIVIPSRSPRQYRANHGTPVSAYIALLDAVDHFKRFVSNKLNIPTAVFINEKDELVSYSRLNTFVKKFGLDLWQTHGFRKSRLRSVTRYNHLMIDEGSAGSKEWQSLRALINDHLQSCLK